MTIFFAILGASQDVALLAQTEGQAEKPPVASERLSEEVVLARALKQLKANNLDQAIGYLETLKDAFPDNDDYLLLYRTAVRKRNSSDPDSQRWYNYQRGLEQKAENSNNSDKSDSDTRARVLSGAAGGVMKVPARPRVNELKVATWVQLTTGKHKSANAGRRSPAQDK